MELKRIIFIFVFGFLYVFLIFLTFIYNNSLSKDFEELASILESPEYALLLDSEGNTLVYNQKKYEAWIDLDFMKKRKEYEKNKYLLNQRFNEEQMQNKKFLKWGVYDTYEEAYMDLGVLNKFSNIYPVTQRVYNELFNLDQLIGKIGKTTYGIEPFLLEKGLLENQDEIRLSIDLELQKIVYQELLKAVEKESAEGGTAIIMESNTGKIKASVSLYPWNIAYMGYIEPGSTLKPLLIALALDENIVNTNDIFYSGYEYFPTGKNNFRVTESQGYGFGEIGLKETIVHSSNIVISKIMNEILKEFSNQWLYEKLINFGFGAKTGVEFKGEINGVLPIPNTWYEITPYQISLGQGIGTTPIQLVSAFNVFANNGKYVQPSFLEDTSTLKRQVISEPTTDIIKDWLGYTVIEGTAKKAYKEGLRIGGKTGTAQKAQSGVGYIKGSYYSLFVGFYPLVDPKYTALIVIDNPKEEFYGGEVAAPVLKDIFYRYTKEQRIETSENKKVYYNNIMPDLTGFSVVEAYNILLNMGINGKDIIIIGNGDKIVSQSISPNKYIDDSKIIELYAFK